jgi:hypothetical protein
MSLQETVGLLRETRVGETVEVCISRQRDGSIPQDFVSFNRLFEEKKRNSFY